METVQIKIKSPSANIDDLQFDCNLKERIIQIKERISVSFPTKPSESAQKLVYSGKILNDSDRLSDILRFEDECSVFTFHLVCSIPQDQKTASSTTSPASSSSGLRHRSNASGASSAAASAGTINPMDSFSQQQAGFVQSNINNPAMEDMMRSFSSQYSQVMASLPSSPTEEEVAALQQMYNQYLSLYMQYMQGQAGAGGNPSTSLFPQQFQLGGEAQAAPAAPEAHAADAGPNPAMVMNAGAAGQIQDEAGADRNRDILDWVYVMTRVLLLFSVIYFHSSFLRLAFVAGLGFLVYVYQNRRNNIRGNNNNARNAPVADQPAAAAAPQDAQERDAADADEIGTEADDSDENSSAADVTTEEEEARPSKLTVALTFISTLVSSIIPEQPQVV